MFSNRWLSLSFVALLSWTSGLAGQDLIRPGGLIWDSQPDFFHQDFFQQDLLQQDVYQQQSYQQGVYQQTHYADTPLQPSAIYQPPANFQPDAFVPPPVDNRWQDNSANEITNAELLEKFNQLEKELEETKASLKETVKSGTSSSTMQIVGRIHLDYWSVPNDSPGANFLETRNPNVSPQDRFGFRRLRFGVRGDLAANMEYRIEMEFALGVETSFRDAYIGFKDWPVLQTVRIGNQKRPYSLDQLNSSNVNVFMERPFADEAFNQDTRRLGICAYGVSEDLAYNWRYGVFNLRQIQEEGNYISDHYQPEFAARLANTIWYDETSDGRGYAHWAVSGTTAYPDGSTLFDPLILGTDRSRNEARFRTRAEARSINRWLDTGVIFGADNYQLLGLEGVVNVGPVQFVGEYQNLWLARDPGFGDDLHFDGGYVYMSYFLTGEHMSWDRETGTLGRVSPFENFFLVDRCDGGIGRGLGAWQVAVRLDRLNLNDGDINGGLGEAVTFGLNWYWTKHARLQFNYILGDVENRDANNNLLNPLIVSGGYSFIGVRAMVDF